jgi:hypothetical protein
METGTFRFKFRTHPWIFVVFLLNFLWIPLKSQTDSAGFSDSAKRNKWNSSQINSESTNRSALNSGYVKRSALSSGNLSSDTLKPSRVNSDTLKPSRVNTDTSKRSSLNSDSLKLKIKEGVKEAISISKDAISVTQDALSTQIDSNRIVISPGFPSHLEAVDTLTAWIFQKKYRKSNNGFLSPTQFVLLARSYDTLSPEVAIKGQYVQYKFTFEKELRWLRKYSRKYSINTNNSSVDPSKVILIRVNTIPQFQMARVEYVIIKKKEEYVVRFELIYMNEQWYYVNKCSIYRDK